MPEENTYGIFIFSRALTPPPLHGILLPITEKTKLNEIPNILAIIVFNTCDRQIIVITKEKFTLKPFIASLLILSLMLAIMTPMVAMTEELEVEQITTSEEGIDLPEAVGIDLVLDEAIVLDGLLPLQEGQGEFSRKPGEDDLAEEIASESEYDSSNATKYGVPATLTLGVKETYTIKCTKSGKLTYKTSNKKIATVSSKGVVTGKKKGSATITVYRKGKKLTTCKVKVAAAPKKVTLNKTNLSLKVKRTFQLVAKVNSGSHARYIWSSSNKSVATVSAKGLVTAKKAGTATITVKTHNGKKATCKVKVTKNASSTLRISPASMTLREGESRDVTVTYTVSDTVYYEIGDNSIVTCAQTSDWYGDDTTLTIYAHSAGSTTITFTNTANNDTATLYITVESKPVDEDYGDRILSINPTSLTMNPNESYDAIVTFTLQEGTVYYDTSDESVATCAWTSNWNGDDTTLTVYAHSAGSATITVTNSVNSDAAYLYITVKASDTPQPKPQPEDEGGDSGVTYRALLIGEEYFPNDTCTRNRGDVTLMNNMLGSVRGPAGGSYSITCRYDLNHTGVINAIRSAFSGADNDDVSLFFIATHGDSESIGSDAGALSLIGSSYEEQWLVINDLANALKEVPGKVIVIIESCGSGAAIYAQGVTENGGNRLRKACIAHDDAIISAFSAADPGIRVREPGSARGITKGALAPNTGELRVENKFYVLTASRYHENSWGTEYGPYNYFTKWLTDGIGTSGSMPADANANRETTLSELFNYISRVGDSFAFPDGGVDYYQHVQVYPKNSAYGLFRR